MCSLSQCIRLAGKEGWRPGNIKAMYKEDRDMKNLSMYKVMRIEILFDFVFMHRFALQWCWKSHISSMFLQKSFNANWFNWNYRKINLPKSAWHICIFNPKLTKITFRIKESTSGSWGNSLTGIEIKSDADHITTGKTCHNLCCPFSFLDAFYLYRVEKVWICLSRKVVSDMQLAIESNKTRRSNKKKYLMKENSSKQKLCKLMLPILWLLKLLWYSSLPLKFRKFYYVVYSRCRKFLKFF